MEITLRDGPFDGQTFTAEGKPTSLLIETDDEGIEVARYRPTREPGVYRFTDYDRVIARIPDPRPEAERGRRLITSRQAE